MSRASIRSAVGVDGVAARLRSSPALCRPSSRASASTAWPAVTSRRTVCTLLGALIAGVRATVRLPAASPRGWWALSGDDRPPGHSRGAGLLAARTLSGGVPTLSTTRPTLLQRGPSPWATPPLFCDAARRRPHHLRHRRGLRGRWPDRRPCMLRAARPWPLAPRSRQRRILLTPSSHNGVRRFGHGTAPPVPWSTSWPTSLGVRGRHSQCRAAGCGGRASQCSGRCGGRYAACGLAKYGTPVLAQSVRHCGR
jgi:hypothetical protein